MNIIWLASYPKSGNTWLRFFLYTYIFGEVKTSNDIATNIPDIHRVSSLDTSMKGPLLVKTHLLCSQTHPYASYSVATIYIVRHPKDILLSCLNYCNMEGINDLSDRGFVAEFINNMGVPLFRSVGMGNWLEHIESWTSSDPAIKKPQLILKYEDMLSNPEESFTRVINFLNIDFDAKRLDTAIKQSSFEILSNLEISEKSRNISSPVFSNSKSWSQDQKFMHKGMKGRALSSIDKDLDEKFDSRFKEYLEKYGY